MDCIRNRRKSFNFSRISMIGLLTEGLKSSTQKALLTQGLQSAFIVAIDPAFFCAPQILNLIILTNPVMLIRDC